MTIFTFSESYLVSFTCINSDPTFVLIAAIMTLGITFSITVYALTTKSDFTIYGGFFL